MFLCIGQQLFKFMKTKKKSKKKGFTLIELLIVIAIIAILSVVVVLTLNPAEMLRRSRDSNRVSDLSVIKTAISLYLADVSTTAMGTTNKCYAEYSGTTALTNYYPFPSSTTWTSAVTTTAGTNVTSAGGCAEWFATASGAGQALNTRSVATAASGWIPINLSLISSGAPIGQWPVDPSYSAGTAGATGENSAARFYSYIAGASNNQYKLAAKMESSLYTDSGTGDLESTDGGWDLNMYEQGSNVASL